MGDKLPSLLLEFRYWRASAPVGALIGASASLWALARWPAISDPRSLISAPAFTVFGSLDAEVWWIFALVACLLIGGWWCNVAVRIASFVQTLLLSTLPLEKDYRSCGRLQQLVLPLSPWELGRLQRNLRATPEYADLDVCDQAGAYRGFLKEALTVPQSALGLNADVNAEILRSLTDMRLTAGLIPWLPVAIAGLSMHVQLALPELATVLNSFAALTGVFLVLTLAAQAKNNADLVASEASNKDRLARHAKLAVGTGRKLSDTRRAQDSIA